MDQLKDILQATRAKKGWNKSQMARTIGLSSQLYGQYEKGEKVPGGDFFVKWKKVFGTDLVSEIETNVSRDTVSLGNIGERVVNNDLSSLIESNLTMSRSIEKNSNSLADLVQMLKDERTHPVSSDLQEFAEMQRQMLAILKAAIVKDAEYKAQGDQEEGRRILREINKATAENLGLVQKKDTQTHGKKSR